MSGNHQTYFSSLKMSHYVNYTLFAAFKLSFSGRIDFANNLFINYFYQNIDIKIN